MKDGRSYEERTDHPLMDGIGYVTDLLNSQERAPPVSMRPTNQMFNSIYRKAGQAYKASTPTRKTKLNKLMNDTIRTSAPQFHIEQLLKVYSETDVDHSGRYQFKLDPNFMSVNSVYKTIALRGIYMKPKRYTLQYALDMKVNVSSNIEQIDLLNQPTFTYTSIDYKRYAPIEQIIPGRRVRGGIALPRIWRVYATITDDQGNEYKVVYNQDHQYLGEYQQETAVIELTVTYDNRVTKTRKHSNTISNIDIGGGKMVTFEFHPQGLATITTRYIQNDQLISEILEVRKTEQWDELTTECEEVKKTKVYHSASKEVKVPFMLTLLPENSIEVFAYEVKRQVNDYLKAHSDVHVQKCEIDYDFSSRTNVLSFTFYSTDDYVDVISRFAPIDDKHQSEAQIFYKILNQIDYKVIPDVYARSIIYENVWNREDFYVHASFMNLVQYNQLGRTGELYPKPTKLTKYTQNIPDIELWTSLNGVDPFILVDQDFDVALALAATLNNADITF